MKKACTALHKENYLYISCSAFSTVEETEQINETYTSIWMQSKGYGCPGSSKIIIINGPCRNGCGTLKNSHCSMAMSVEHRSKFAALHRQWWRLHISEKFSSWKINSNKTNKIVTNTLIIVYKILIDKCFHMLNHSAQKILMISRYSCCSICCGK